MLKCGVSYMQSCEEFLFCYKPKKHPLVLYQTLEPCVQMCRPYKHSVALCCSLWRSAIRLKGFDSHAEPSERREALGAGSVTTLIRGIINPFLVGLSGDVTPLRGDKRSEVLISGCQQISSPTAAEKRSLVESESDALSQRWVWRSRTVHMLSLQLNFMLQFSQVTSLVTEQKVEHIDCAVNDAGGLYLRFLLWSF